MAVRQKPSDGIGFATLQPNVRTASAQLVENMRATLRHAQEISAAVDDAEVVAEQARAAARAAEAGATEAERAIVASELERLNKRCLVASRSSRKQFQVDKADLAIAGSTATAVMAPSPSLVDDAAGSTAATLALHVQGEASGDATPRPTDDLRAPTNVLTIAGATTAGATSAVDAAIAELESGGRSDSHGAAALQNPRDSTASQMRKEIETTVMWVHQLLESVHLIESDTAIDPGASVLNIVKPRLRHQKDEALARSLTEFNEKKEAENDVDEKAGLWRNQALQAVMAKKTTQTTRSSPMA